MANVLLWAAGGTTKGDIHTDKVDEENLFRLLVCHGLAHRFLFRLKSGQVHQTQSEEGGSRYNVSKDFLEKLIWQCALEKRRVWQQIEAMQEIVYALNTPQTPPIAIKGFSCYLLKQSDSVIRYSSDMDLFYPEPEHFVKTLARLGYASSEPIADHEHSVWTRENICIEYHNHFPIVAYPDELLASFSSPISTSVPQMFQTDHHVLIANELRYNDLLPYRFSSVSPRTGGISILSPTMTALILCAHLFKDYTDRALQIPNVIPLAAIADLYDLTNHPQFEIELFRELSARFQTKDASDFGFHLLDTYFGSTALSDLGGDPAIRTQFPQNMWWGMGVWTIPTSTSVLVREMRDLCEELGCNTIRATPHTGPQAGAATNDLGARARERSGYEKIVWRHTGEGPIPINLQVVQHPGMFVFILEIPLYSYHGEPNVLFFHFGESELRWKIRDTIRQFYGPSAGATFELSSTTVRYQINISTDVLPSSMGKSGHLWMLLGLMLWKAPQNEAACLCTTSNLHCYDWPHRAMLHTEALILPIELVFTPFVCPPLEEAM